MHLIWVWYFRGLDFITSEILALFFRERYAFWLIKETESPTSAFPQSDCFLKLVRIGKRSCFMLENSVHLEESVLPKEWAGSRGFPQEIRRWSTQGPHSVSLWLQHLHEIAFEYLVGKSFKISHTGLRLKSFWIKPVLSNLNSLSQYLSIYLLMMLVSIPNKPYTKTLF